MTAHAELLVFEKPIFIRNIPLEMMNDYGSSVTLPCDAIGVSQPNITWLKNAENVTHLIGTRLVFFTQIDIIVISPILGPIIKC